MKEEEQLDLIEEDALLKVKEASSQNDLNDLRAYYTGKKSPLGEILKAMVNLAIEQKKIIGKKANEVKTRIEECINERRKELEEAAINHRLQN